MEGSLYRVRSTVVTNKLVTDYNTPHVWTTRANHYHPLPSATLTTSLSARKRHSSTAPDLLVSLPRSLFSCSSTTPSFVSSFSFSRFSFSLAEAAEEDAEEDHDRVGVGVSELSSTFFPCAQASTTLKTHLLTSSLRDPRKASPSPEFLENGSTSSRATARAMPAPAPAPVPPSPAAPALPISTPIGMSATAAAWLLVRDLEDS